MHAARLDRSSRLQRVHELLSEGAEHSTLDIVQGAEVCAVNSIIAELRHAGAEITCRQVTSGSGQRVWLYRMTAPAPENGQMPERTDCGAGLKHRGSGSPPPGKPGSAPDAARPGDLSSSGRTPEQIRRYLTPRGFGLGHVGEGHEFRQLGLFW